MSISTDPTYHRSREIQFMRHIRSLLTDGRLRLDTTQGARPITQLIANVHHSDRSMDLKNLMIQLNRPDRDLQQKMPIGEWMEVTLGLRQFLLLQRTIGRLRVMCVSPNRALLSGEAPKPLTAQEVTKVLSELPPSLGGVPTTVVLVSTGGYTLEAHELVDRRPDRTLILI